MTGQHEIPLYKTLQTLLDLDPSTLSRSKRRACLDTPMTRLQGHDVVRLETTDQRAVGAKAAERHLEMNLIPPNMDRRAFVPLAARPAVAGAGHEIAKLVVTMVLPDHDLAAGQPHVRKVARIVDRRLIATVEAIDVRVHDAHRFRQRIAHRWPSPSLIS